MNLVKENESADAQAISTENKAYIQSVEPYSGQNRHERINPASGVKIKKGKAKDAATKFMCMLNKKGELASGFDTLVTNPWYGLKAKDLTFPTGHDVDKIVEKKNITKQTWLEILDNEPKGYYHAKAPTMFTDLDKEPAGFLSTFTWWLQDGLTILDTSERRERLIYNLCLHHPLIARSKEHVIPNIHRFYIAKENETEIEKAIKGKKLRRASSMLNKVEEEMGDEYIVKLAVVLQLSKVVIPVSKALNLVSDYITKESLEREENIEKFTEKAKLLTDENGVARFNVEYLARRLMAFNIITTTLGKYKWLHAPDESLQIWGLSFDELVSNMLDAEKGEHVSAMLEQLKVKEGNTLY